jgi:hypothetical protein
MNVLCRLQEEHGIHPQHIGVNAGFKEMRALVWAGLEGARKYGCLEKNADGTEVPRQKEWKLGDAGNIIDQVGLKETMDVVSKALGATMGVEEDESVEGDEGNPPGEPAPGTGTDSSLTV